MTTLLATLEDFAEMRGVQYDPTDLKALIQLEAASGAVRTYTGQDFDYVEDDERLLDGHGTRSLLLPQLPVHDVSEVAVLASDGTETLLDPAEGDWTLGAAGLLYRRYGWRSGVNNVRVVHSHGYVMPGADEIDGIPSFPAELSDIVMARAGRRYSRAASGGQLVGAKSVGSFRVEYDNENDTESGTSGWIDDELEILEHYRYPTEL